MFHFDAEASDLLFRCGAEVSDVVFHFDAEASDLVFRCGAEVSDLLFHFGAEVSDLVFHFGAEVSDLVFHFGVEASDVVFHFDTEANDLLFRCGAKLSDVVFRCGAECSHVGLGGDVSGHGIADRRDHGFGLSFLKPDFFEGLDRGMSVKRECHHGVHPASHVPSLSRPSETPDGTRRFLTFAVNPRSSFTRIFWIVTILPRSEGLHGRSWFRCLWRDFDRHRCGRDPAWRFD